MRILVLSDVHANLEALEAVLAAAGGWDDVWFLGDAVGYGPDPEACLERLAGLEPAVWLAGNHDHAALGKIDPATFNTDARKAAEWTGRRLSADQRRLLEGARVRVEDARTDTTLVHGSPRQPLHEYILTASTADENFRCFTSALCLFGHTHVPVIYEAAVDGTLRHSPEPGRTNVLDRDTRWLVNPGGVGQPRDGDARASYMLFDPEAGSLVLHRVEYDIERTQAKIKAAGLPARLAQRLALGW